jgi:hypothetical protein
VFNTTFSKHFSYIMSINLVVKEAGVLGEEPPTMDKQLTNFITCESSALFFVIYKAGRKPKPYW